MSALRSAISLFLVLTVLTGGAYPLITTVLGQWWFPWQAMGSRIEVQGQVRGSALIGQEFTQAGYFHGRPSATAEFPYNPMASGGSNLAVGNPMLTQELTRRAQSLRRDNPQSTGPIPVALLTASGSGLDGQLPPEAALWQIPRIAAVRHIPKSVLTTLVEQATHYPVPGFIGEPVVNVLSLNLALASYPASN
ncbi:MULTISPECIES: potassium-transporting ATPase subunit KdpC [Mangrovibacter]|uniref:Potassium-transporting ATPase KdpC subunit n=1 Tax=Mangrovibacter plantisponsor TaxID=451513 RepID=A0A317PY08_9ENTR|nr:MULTISPECIES: potassium-transporting ATPase subunit KdpC [Mangrovibacter]KEA51933.1 potassium-transporting ATPase subunit C [Mangrovibacter sp. MFB070]PWW07986.1 K+-transporting ATPase ATPase C chain [Mangrovibacter plantisponsor]